MGLTPNADKDAFWRRIRGDPYTMSRCGLTGKDDAAVTKLMRKQRTVDYEENHLYEDVVTVGSKKYSRTTKTLKGGTDCPDVVTRTLSDVAGRVAMEYLAGQLTASYTYDKLGNKLSQTDANGNQTTFTYDYAGRLLQTTRDDDSVSTVTYDALGRRTATRDFAGHQTTYTYDDAGRLLQTTSPFDNRSAQSKCYYDANGNLTTQKVYTGSYWRETGYVYDARGRQTSVYQYENDARTRYLRSVTVYDAVGNRLETRTGYTHASSAYRAVKYTYNRFGGVLSITDPMGRKETYTYDALGLLLRKTDRNGSTTTYGYDPLDRIIDETTTSRTEKHQYVNTRGIVYGRTGQKLSETVSQSKDGAAPESLATSYTYDSKGRLATQSDPDNVTKTYAYDPNGNRQSFVLRRDGATQLNLHYTYNNLNRLTAVRSGGASGAVMAEYQYDPNGNRTRKYSPAAQTETTYAYNKANLVTSLVNRRGNTVYSTFAYTYHLDGNQATKTGQGSTVTYTYDRLGRLTVEDDSKYNRMEYRYDAFGNRAQMKVTPNGFQIDKPYRVDYDYDKSNRLLRETRTEQKASEITNYRYDANGSQLYKEWQRTGEARWDDPPGKIGFVTKNTTPGFAVLDLREYNGWGQLVWASRDTMEAFYTYRPDGLRHSKTTGKIYESPHKRSTTTQHWDGQNLVLETDGHITKGRYLRGGGLICQIIDASILYYLLNAHGDVVQRMYAGGEATPQYEYDP